MKEKMQIGWYNVPEDTEMTDRGFDCAAWSRTIAIKAGKYPVMSSGYERHEREGRYTERLDDTSLSIMLEGPIVRDDFTSHFCGNPFGNYDTQKNAGKIDSIRLAPYAHAVAWSIAGGGGNIELLPRFEARIIDFEYNGETHQTAAIIDREKERV